MAKGERGQATVEFAVILPVVLLVIVGLISFGKAFNYWLDLNHMANESARWAVVNKVPPTTTAPEPKDLEQYVVNQVVDSSELKTLITTGFNPSQANPNANNCVDSGTGVPVGQKWTFCFCYGDNAAPATDPPQIGDPVRVTVRVPSYNLSFFGKLPLTINLAGVSTQRLEQLPLSTQNWKHCTT
jgi:Flp pilus assembly protein TadG